MRYQLTVLSVLLAICLTSWGQTGELPRSTPESQGVATNILHHFHEVMATSPDMDIHHIMILRHGKVISEYHAHPYRPEDPHLLYSASKTVTALAVGLAVDDGLLTVDDKVSCYLRDKMPAMLSPALDSLTVRHLLTMTAGREQDFSIFEGKEDWLECWFKGSFSGVGQVSNYDSMCTHALATIVTRVTGQQMLDYVNKRIFKPLHITQADWELAPDSIEIAGWGMRLQAESQAKLGQLMLQRGNWHGLQLVSSQWIDDMSQMHLRDKVQKPVLTLWQSMVRALRRIWHTVRSWFTGYDVDDYYKGYGYQTRILHQPLAESYFAAGYGGQIIDVVRRLDMVVVVNGRAADYGDIMNNIYYHLIVPIINNDKDYSVQEAISYDIRIPQGNASHAREKQLFASRITLDDNRLGLSQIEVNPHGRDREFIMTDKRGPLHAIAACGAWRLTTNDERPIYIMEALEPLVGTRRPFTSAAAYAWQGDTLAMRLDWLDGGDNRRMRIVLAGDSVKVLVIDNYDHLLTDTINGTIEARQ